MLSAPDISIQYEHLVWIRELSHDPVPVALVLQQWCSTRQSVVEHPCFILISSGINRLLGKEAILPCHRTWKIMEVTARVEIQ